MSGLHSAQITALFVNVKIKSALFKIYKKYLETVNAKLNSTVCAIFIIINRYFKLDIVTLKFELHAICFDSF
jgi:hypothetical protein